MILEISTLILSYLTEEIIFKILNKTKNKAKYLSLIKSRFKDVKVLIYINQYYTIKYLISIGRKYTQKHMFLAVKHGRRKIINLFRRIGLHVAKKDFEYLVIHDYLDLVQHYHTLNPKTYRIDNGLADIALKHGRYQILKFLLQKDRKPSVDAFMDFYRNGYQKFKDGGRAIFKLLLQYKISYLRDSYSYLSNITYKHNQHLLDICTRHLESK